MSSGCSIRETFGNASDCSNRAACMLLSRRAGAPDRGVPMWAPTTTTWSASSVAASAQ
jgi:hypothetical protein